MATAAASILALAACNKAPPPAPQNAATTDAQNTSDMSGAPEAAPGDNSGSYAAGPAPAAAPALPLDRSPPAAPAPAAAALPPAPVEAPSPPVQQYRYVDQAAALSSALANVPPNYAIDYQGTKPWVWRAPNGGYRVVETIPGGQRTYFYAPGARAPYLVRDTQYTYAFDNGRLAVVYGPAGQALPAAVAARQAAIAGRYFQRAQWLHDAAMNSRKEAASAADWRAHQAAMAAQQAARDRDRRQNADWRAWEAQQGGPPAPNGPPPKGPGWAPPGPRPSPGQGPGSATPGQARQQAREAQRLSQAQARVDDARKALAEAQVRSANMPPAQRARILHAAQVRVDQAVGAQSRIEAAVAKPR
jgi:hypothetical protein